MIASNETFVTAAYALTWVVVLVYALRLVSKDARARADYGRAGVRPEDTR